MPTNSQWEGVCEGAGGAPCPEIFRVSLMGTDLTGSFTSNMLRIYPLCPKLYFIQLSWCLTFLWLSLKWKLSWFVQDTELNHSGKYTKVVISFVFQGLKGTSRAGRTLKLFSERKGRLLRSERKAQREEGRATRHTFCPRGNSECG